MFQKKKTDPLESAIQRKIIKRYEDDGYLVVKIGLCNKGGFPDLMLLKDGKASFVEVNDPDKSHNHYKNTGSRSCAMPASTLSY